MKKQTPPAVIQPNSNVNESLLQRIPLENRPIPDLTASITKMKQAGMLDARANYFQQLTDASGKNGKDLRPEENEDIRRILGPNVSSAFKPTYSYEELIRYHEAWREDGIIAMCLELLAQSIFGDHFKTVIDTNKEYNTEEERKAALDQLTNNPTLLRYKAALDKINKDCKATNAFKAMFIQGGAFGSAASIIERDKDDNLPIAIKILPSMSLGRRFAHKSTWELLGIEYLDYQFPDSILPASDVIYLAFRDYHMSPGTFHYGYSLIEKVIYLSETNRVINQRNLPETNFRLWSPMLLATIPGSLNQGTLDKTRDALRNGAGNVIVVNQQTRIEPVAINVSVQEMTNERLANNLEIIRQMQFPEILYNPDIMNRATAQEVMESWNIFTLQPYQSWIGDIIQDQWIDPILKTLIDNDAMGIADEPSEIAGYIPPSNRPEDQTPTPTSTTGPAVTKPGVQARARSLILIKDPRTGEVEISDQEWRIKVIFEPANMDTFLDKVKAYMILFAGGAGPVSGERVLKGIGLDDEIPVYQERQQQKLEFQQQQFKLQQQVQDIGKQNQVRDQTQQQQQQDNTPNIPQYGPHTGFNADVAGSLAQQIKDATKVSPSAASILEDEYQQRSELLDKVAKRILEKIEEI